MSPSFDRRYKRAIWPWCKWVGSSLLAISSIVGTYYSIKSYYSPSATTASSPSSGASIDDSETNRQGSNTFTSEIGTKYTRKSVNDEADLEIKQITDKWSLKGEQVHVHGIALYGTNPKLHPGSPNIGELDFVAPIEKNHVKYSEDLGKGRLYRMSLTFDGDKLEVNEEYIPQYAPVMFGLNVSFAGTYQKVGAIKEVKPL